jgi:deazaflavin-dependent oxidoreductase (nitroreductase family)
MCVIVPAHLMRRSEHGPGEDAARGDDLTPRTSKPEVGTGFPRMACCSGLGGDFHPATCHEGMTPAPGTDRRAKPLLGVRRQPGRLALAVFRLPLPLYQRGWGWLLGHTFLLVTHTGRKTGKRHDTVAMALTYDPETHGAVVCSGWGQNADWIRNIRAHPALQIQIGRESYIPEQRFLSEDESFAVAVEFRREHPRRLRLIARILGWGDLSSDSAVRDFVRSHPFVSFRPAHSASP